MTSQETHTQHLADFDHPVTEVIMVARPAPVFVDSTGRRGRFLRRFSYGFGAFCMVYGGLISLSLAGGPVSPNAVLPFPALINGAEDGAAEDRPSPTPEPAVSAPKAVLVNEASPRRGNEPLWRDGATATSRATPRPGRGSATPTVTVTVRPTTTPPKPTEAATTVPPVPPTLPTRTTPPVTPTPDPTTTTTVPPADTGGAGGGATDEAPDDTPTVDAPPAAEPEPVVAPVVVKAPPVEVAVDLPVVVSVTVAVPPVGLSPGEPSPDDDAEPESEIAP